MRRLADLLWRVEQWLLGGLMLALVVLAVAQIARRLLFQDGWFGVEAVGRSLVLWIALLGALAATRERRHVAIDLWVGSRLPAGLRSGMHRLAHGLAGVFCAAMAWFGWNLLQLEREGAASLVSGIPMWWTVTVIPLGFALMALRFLVAAAGPPGEHPGKAEPR